MAISEEALAIIASNLTAAQCALAGPFALDREIPDAETAQQVVERMFRSYLRRLQAGHFSHDLD